MSEIKYTRFRKLDASIEADLERLRNNPELQARMAAHMKRTLAELTAQSFGVTNASEFALSQLTDAERATLAKQAEPVERKLLESGA